MVAGVLSSDAERRALCRLCGRQRFAQSHGFGRPIQASRRHNIKMFFSSPTYYFPPSTLTILSSPRHPTPSRMDEQALAFPSIRIMYTRISIRTPAAPNKRRAEEQRKQHHSAVIEIIN